jgi:hypothetical protein
MSVHAHDPQSSTHSRRILSGRFQFIEGRVQEAHFDGEYVSSELSGKIAAEVTNNKDWTAADMTRAFDTAGARFASRSSDEFLREMKFERFETLLGRVSDLRARFIAVPPIRASETDPEFKPFWLVTIETISRPDVRRRYDLTFELFNGRLTSLVELN